MTYVPGEKDRARRESDRNKQDAAFAITVLIAIAIGICLPLLIIEIIKGV